MSAEDSADTQVSEWAPEAQDVAAAMALTTAKTASLDAYAATQVIGSPPPTPTSKPEPTSTPSTTPSATPSDTSPEKSSLEAPASTKQPGKDAPDQDMKLTDSSMMEARTNYAEHHGLPIEQVSEEMVKGHEKGQVYWSTLKTNLTARGAAGQALNRALKHRPDVRELYNVLLDSEKVAFRAAWSCTREFEFVTTRRTTTNSFRRRKEDLGVFKTQLQLEQVLGGSDKTEAVLQAKNYVSMCLRPDLKAFCYMYNDWLKADTFLWVESLVATSSETAWVNEVTVEHENPIAGSWTEKAEFCKAARVYAVEQKIQVKDVTTAMLEKTALGIRGYAKLYESTPAAFPQPGGDGSAGKQTSPEKPPAPAAATAKAKAKGKAKASKAAGEPTVVIDAATAGMTAPEELDGANPGDDQPASKKPKKSGGNPTGKKEREVKDFLAPEAESDNMMSKIAASMGADPSAWTWAKDFVQQYRTLRAEILAMYADIEFFSQAKVAALSTKETAKLKKMYGLEYANCFFFKDLEKGPEKTGLDDIASGRVIKILRQVFLWRMQLKEKMLNIERRCHLGKEYGEPYVEYVPEVIVPDDETHQKLHSLLRYSKNGRGRCLKAAFPLLDLRRGNRLEPSANLLDVDKFMQLTTPFSCTFYTGGPNGRILHQSPSLKIPGVTLDCWCIDVLHTWHFGPLSSYIAHSLRLLLSSPVYRPAARDLDKEEADKLALLHLRAELWSFYKRCREADEDGTWRKKGTEVFNLTLNMLAGKYLKAKAAETHGLLNFVVDRIGKHSESLASTSQAASFDLLLRAGKAAMDFDAVLAAHPRAIDAETCGLLFDNYNRFICLATRAEVLADAADSATTPRSTATGEASDALAPESSVKPEQTAARHVNVRMLGGRGKGYRLMMLVM
ncbi:unnamed protein product, partial [Symbiodinium sp. KB8]